MQWSEVIGQEELSTKLRELARQRHLPHAMLIHGAVGYGSMTMALALATYVQCRQPGEQDSCGKCDQCKKNAKLENPDLILSFPTVSKGGPTTADDFYPEFIEFQREQPYHTLSQWLRILDAEKKQANITAKESRRIIERLSLKPVSAEYKVLVMWLPEYLGKEGNMLLKLIEEPTPNTLMILVSEDSNRLLSTIKSRVQEITVPPIATDPLAEAAAARLPLLHAKSPDYNSYKGDWNKVLEASQPSDTDMEQLFKGYLNAVFRNDAQAQVEWVDDMQTYSKNEILSFVLYAQSRLHSLMRATDDTPDKVLSKLKKYNISLEQIACWRELLDDVHYSIKRNTQLNLSLHNLVIRSSYVVREYEIS